MSLLLLFAVLLGRAVWGSRPAGGAGAPPGGAPAQAESALTAFELEHGIGPMKEVVVLGDLDPALAAAGKAEFETKCSACHKMAEKYVGPALGDVTTRRSPTFIMNMILNPMEMVERHPEGKKMLAENMTFMANQGETVEQARALLEYLRTQATGTVRTQ
jgi:mono/diheme cytochrome c family protein